MNTDSFLICDENHEKLCKIMFKVLNCNLLWIMNLNNNQLTMLVSDSVILDHYWDKKYYLQDPNINIKRDNDSSPWKVTLGTDCNSFTESGFLHDLYNIFKVEEFVSIEKKIGQERYCFRFFTKNNRYVFMNKLLNDMPIIKYFINATVEKFKVALLKQKGIDVQKWN
jgi:hypothetical protein